MNDPLGQFIIQDMTKLYNITFILFDSLTNLLSPVKIFPGIDCIFFKLSCI